jgi:hypothetical protein
MYYLSDYCDVKKKRLYYEISRFFVVFYFQKTNLDGFSDFFEFWSFRIGTRIVRSRTKIALKIKCEN